MLCCMRTTIRLDDRLLRELKQHAARHGRTLTAVVEEALRQFLARSEQRTPRKPFKVLTFKGQPTGLRPGVDLDDTAALIDIMEGRR